jgi:hypothetical protein
MNNSKSGGMPRERTCPGFRLETKLKEMFMRNFCPKIFLIGLRSPQPEYRT